MILAASLTGMALAGSLATTDTTRLTRLEMVLDSATWADVRASTWLPVAYGNGYLAGPGEVRLCDRLTCLVMLPPDATTDRQPGDVSFGLMPRTGSALGDRLDSLQSPRARLSIADAPPAPDPLIASDSLPIAYYLASMVVSVPLGLIPDLEVGFRSGGATVYREGQGLVVQFENQDLRVMPAWGEPGVERITLRLRRDLPGNPTFRFGPTSRLRFEPLRKATWTF